MAFGGLMACEQLGIKCPSEIGIVGYNGLNINSVLQQKITTSKTPRRQMGEKGAKMLVAKILGAVTPSIIQLPVKVIPGGTTHRRY